MGRQNYTVDPVTLFNLLRDVGFIKDQQRFITFSDLINEHPEEAVILFHGVVGDGQEFIDERLNKFQLSLDEEEAYFQEETGGSKSLQEIERLKKIVTFYKSFKELLFDVK